MSQKPPPSKSPSRPSIRFALEGLNLHRAKPVIFTYADTITQLQSLISTAIDRGASIIVIRRVHQIPEAQTQDKPEEEKTQ